MRFKAKMEQQELSLLSGKVCLPNLPYLNLEDSEGGSPWNSFRGMYFRDLGIAIFFQQKPVGPTENFKV